MLWSPLVTEATGCIGRDVVKQSLEGGHGVFVLTRSRSNATHPINEVTVVEGTITDKETMREPMTDVG